MPTFTLFFSLPLVTCRRNILKFESGSKMAARQTESQGYVAKFCSYIEALIEAWNTAGDLNYRSQPEEPGCKANYWAVKLGLTTLGNKLPYEREKWWSNSTAKGAKEKWPERPQELQEWKKRANALEPDATLHTLNLETHVTKEKVDKFIRVADEAIDIQRHSEDTFDRGENPHLCVKGRVVNELALELGLIDSDWYLAKKCNLIQTNTFAVDPQKDKQLSLRLYEELGIDPACGKQPLVFTDGFNRNDYIDEDELQMLVTKAEALRASIVKKTEHRPEEESPMLSDFEHPVPCSHVAGIIRKRSDNIARSLRSHKYPVIVSGARSYCDAEHAAVLWPKWKKYWREKQK